MTVVARKSTHTAAFVQYAENARADIFASTTGSALGVGIARADIFANTTKNAADVLFATPKATSQNAHADRSNAIYKP